MYVFVNQSCNKQHGWRGETVCAFSPRQGLRTLTRKKIICALVERNCVLFYVFKRKGITPHLNYLVKYFNFSMWCDACGGHSVYGHAKKGIIYAWIVHRWIMNRSIAYCELAQTNQNWMKNTSPLYVLPPSLTSSSLKCSQDTATKLFHF